MGNFLKIHFFEVFLGFFSNGCWQNFLKIECLTPGIQIDFDWLKILPHQVGPVRIVKRSVFLWWVYSTFLEDKSKAPRSSMEDVQLSSVRFEVSNTTQNEKRQMMLHETKNEGGKLENLEN